MKDFFTFRRMLMPVFIHSLFWFGSIACILVGIYDLTKGEGIWLGLQVLIFGPIMIRILCEFLILFFRMNETLTDIKNTLQLPRD